MHNIKKILGAVFEKFHKPTITGVTRRSYNEDNHNDEEDDFVPEFALHVGELHEIFS